MEENQNDVQNVETNDSEVSEKSGGLKSKKGLIIAIIVAVVAILVIFNVFFNTKGKAKKVVKQYISAINKADVKKTIKLVDPYGEYVFGHLNKDEYDDFWDEYKDFVKEKDDDYEEVKEDYEDSLDSDEIKEAKEAAKEAMEDVSVKVKKIKSVKKESKNLYKVKVKIEVKEDDDKATRDITFYVMKKGLKCYIVSAGI